MYSLRALPRQTRQIRTFATAYTYTSPGAPTAVLSREQRQVSKPSNSDLSLQWLAAGVDPVDLAALSGNPSAAAYAPTAFPAVPGNEGVARVTAAGAGVNGISEGDLVIPIKTSLGTWCESSVLDHSQVITVPERIPLELAATLSASPFTAYRILHDFVTLSPGDVILQNAGSTPVGTAIVQLAKAMGVQTISLVNTSSADYAPTVERLKLMGGDVVIGEPYVSTNGFQQVLLDMPKPSLVINGGNEASSATLAGLAPEGSTIVTYCPGVIDSAALTGKGCKGTTFSLPDWLEQADRVQVQSMVTDLTGMIDAGQLTAWLQRVKFDQLPVAIQQGGMIDRKLVAVMDAQSS